MSGERDIYFLSKNYVNPDDTLNASSGALLLPRLYDQSYLMQWQSIGETSELLGYNTYIEVIFKEGSVAVSRTFDTLVLQNINLKKFKFQYDNGGLYSDIDGTSFTTNAATSLRIKLAAPVTTTKIRLVIESTIIANEEKKIGELWAMLETYRLENSFTKRNRQDTFQGNFYRLGDGTGGKWKLYDKWGKVYTLRNLTDTQLAALESIYRAHSLFTFYENYTRNIDLIKQVFWVGNFTGEDRPKVGLELNDLSMEIVEK
jgi:hypothetical protein